MITQRVVSDIERLKVGPNSLTAVAGFYFKLVRKSVDFDLRLLPNSDL